MSRLIIAAFALLLAGCTAIAPERPRATVSTESTASGAEPSDRELQEKWWTWAVSSTEDRNPVADSTGEFCGVDQPADVWFFAGTFGGHADRTCQVPAGRPLAGPAVNTMSNCGSLMRTAKGSVTLDGQPVELRRMEAAPITVKAVEGNPLGLRAGRREGQACGLWAWIEPLTPGEHELRIEGESGDFKTSARYKITVGSAA